ncbi:MULTISPECIES: hypothetical protein [Actinosynnema]|uniref:hypothetical protein n=1 Tax=Actinosynnema TaxID=40566 RepID=UPI0020A56E55|nr:hypothetical protein [Actinosynnema pretiosum]MCP2098385.1 hypothetical protein [Actinosynnema pretiosum]
MWASDERLLADLGRALAEAPAVPEEYLVAGRAAFEWRDVDAELLLVTGYDSLLDGELAGRARGGLATRQLVFDADGRSVQVEVDPAGVTGQVLPPATGRVELESAAGVVESVELDELGYFLLGPLPRGAARLRVGGVAVTEWFLG